MNALLPKITAFLPTTASAGRSSPELHSTSAAYFRATAFYGFAQRTQPAKSP